MINTLHVLHSDDVCSLVGQTYVAAHLYDLLGGRYQYCFASAGEDQVYIVANLVGNEMITMLLLQGKIRPISQHDCSGWLQAELSELVKSI